MKRNTVLMGIGLLLLVLVAVPQVHATPKKGVPKTVTDAAKEPSVYLVSEYDPQRDPAKDLAQALKLAQRDGRNVILQVGGNWCSWCRKMTDFFENTQSVRDVLSKNYVIMKVNFSNENKNVKFLSAYPRVPAYPHLFVLDSSGKLLCSQHTGDLEQGGSYSEKTVLAFLNKWTPAAVAKAAAEK